ncbi:ATP-binding protein [Paenibacillus sp. TRM 82003]|nr:ATP-binding protein [Paenibacillus sp. TRM 82003]
MSIRQRLYLGFASIIGFIAIFAWAMVSLLSTINDDMDQIIDNRYWKVTQHYQIEREISTLHDALERLVVLDSTEALLRTVQTSRTRVEFILAQVESRLDTENGRLLYEETSERYRMYEDGIEHYLVMLNADVQPGAAVDFLMSDLEESRLQLRDSLSKFSTHQENMMMSTVEASRQQQQSTMTFVWAGIALLLAICTVTAMNVVSRTIRSIRRISAVMDQAKEHEIDRLPRMAMDQKDELGGIVAAYNRMVDMLERQAAQEIAYKEELERETWVKTHVAETTNLFQGERNLRPFAERLLQTLVPTAGAAGGALYYLNETNAERKLVRLAAYALKEEEAEHRSSVSFDIGEGLVGQCARDGRWVELQAPADYLRIESGLGATDRVSLLLIPVLFEGTVIAVLELASLAGFEPEQLDYVRDITNGSLGISLHNVANQMRIQGLLSESQQYVEELQTQSEELQQQQEELRSLNERLAEQFREANQRSNELELIRTELEAKANELQVSSQFKSEFLANMSHELRTPLNSLLILAQMLGENPERNLTEKQKEYARTILYSGNELLALINDILDLSKIEAGQMELVEDAFTPRELTSELERQFSGVAMKKGLSFRIHADDSIADVVFRTDEKRLTQVLNNVLSNAFKFTETGGVSMYVYEAARDGANGTEGVPARLAFQIRDTGIGIPADKQDVIFEAFRQVDGKTNRKYGGTGLGLSISKELTAMLGGTIELQSEPARGSVFTVIVPMKRSGEEIAVRTEASEERASAMSQIRGIAETAATLEETEQGKTAASSTGLTASGAGKILLVDDDIRNVYALTAALTEQSFEVVFAENGRAALELLEAHPDTDIVLMDMMMPEMDGYEATRAIRSNPRWFDLPVIAVTAKAMKQDRELCLEAGANDYVSKPVKLDKLLSLIRVWMNGRGKDA